MEQKSFAVRHPYVFTTLIVLTIVAVYLFSGTAAFLLKLPNPDFSLYFIANATLTLIFVALLTRMRWWKATGFRTLSDRRHLWLFALPFIPVLGNLIFGIQAHKLSSILTYLALAALIGFVEEAAFRGLILQALAPRGPWRAAIISAILFGLVHAMNALSGSDPLYMVLQIGYAMAIGFCWAAVVLRTKVIWPLVVIHGLIDFAGFVAGDRLGGTDVDAVLMGMAAFYIVSFTTYGVYLLRTTRPAARVLSPSPVQS